MGQDVVKGFKLNGKLVQTGRDELSESSLVALAGFGRSARVRVTVEPPVTSSEGPRTLQVGDVVPVVAGMSVTVKVAPAS